MMWHLNKEQEGLYSWILTSTLVILTSSLNNSMNSLDKN